MCPANPGLREEQGTLGRGKELAEPGEVRPSESCFWGAVQEGYGGSSRMNVRICV